jgi:hypothetical protein
MGDMGLGLGYGAGGFAEAVDNIFKQRQAQANWVRQQQEAERQHQAEEDFRNRDLAEKTAFRQDTFHQKQGEFDQQQQDRDLAAGEKLGQSTTPGPIEPTTFKRLTRLGQEANLGTEPKDVIGLQAPPVLPGAGTGPDSPAASLSQLREAQPATTFKWLGTPQQREKLDAETKRKAYVGGLPAGSPLRTAAEYEDATGKNAPADLLKDPNAPLSLHQKERDYDNAHPSPGSNAAADDRHNARTDRSYQQANTALEAARKPLADQAERFGRLIETINQTTPQADALIAPELLTVMAGGAGSGLRMNEAEISRLVNGRTNLESLKAALNKWQADPSKGLSITPAQRGQIRQLIAAVKTRSDAKLDLINKASEALIDAPDVESHRRIVSTVKKQLDAVGTAAPTGGVTVTRLD